MIRFAVYVMLLGCVVIPSTQLRAQTDLAFAYDATSGNLSFETDARLTTLQIESANRLFTGPRPPGQFLPPFDVYRRGLMFLLRPTNGLGSTDFGPVLSSGLSHDEVAADLCVTGSLLPSGLVQTAYLTTPAGPSLSLICDEEPTTTDGFVLTYEPASGAMRFFYDGDAPLAATSLVIDSRADLFTGERPTVLDGQFDVFRPDRLFHLEFDGFTSLSLGEIATVELALDRVANDLCVAGSLVNGGAIDDVRLNDRSGLVLPTCQTAPPTVGGPSSGGGGGGIAIGPGPFDVSFYYDRTTGDLSIESPSLLTTLEIVSAEPIFTGPKPPQVLPPFDVYEPLKLFVIRPDGFASEGFGPVFEPNLDVEELAALLTVNGSLWPTGSIGTVGFVIPEAAPRSMLMLVALLLPRFVNTRRTRVR